MKRKLIYLLLCCSIAFSLIACTNSETEDSKSDVSSGDKTESSAVPEDNSETSTEPTSDTKKEITFKEMTVVDNDQCSIQITGIDADNLMGYTLNIRLENKSSDKTYMFSAQDGAINGVQCDPICVSEVAAGKVANETLYFSDSKLEENGIIDYTDIELWFRVYDSDDWSDDAVADEHIHVYPYGEENVTQFVREAKDSDNILVDNDNITIIVTDCTTDSIWGYTVNMFLINKTNTEVMFSVDEASINGVMADPYFATTVKDGKSKFASVSWSNSTLSENQITEVKDIEFNITAYNSEDLSAPRFIDEKITLNP